MSKRPTFEQAKAQFVHRYTMEHVPAWALRQHSNGCYYAPQFRTDSEWYAATLFHGEPGHIGTRNECFTNGQTWPLGKWLNASFKR